MKKSFFRACIQALFLLLFSFQAFSQVETLSTGSFIINMGATNPNTVGNGLKPYGLVYDLIKNYNVPVRWVISQTKLKDGADFNYNGTDYKGGTFIIPAEFRTTAVNNRITFWQGQGVVGTTTISALTVDVTRTLIAVPRWTLDATNGSIAQGYLTNAGITLTAFPGAYNFKAVAALDCCDDFFVMPHADPTWATHGRLFTWNRDCLGSIWAACHAVSALENSINPSNSAEQMNFLSTRNLLTTPTPWPNNSLKLWGTHGGGSVPYSYQFPGDQVAQFMGTTDLAQLNGSEQIYIPKQSTDAGGATRWRPGSKIIGYDPTQANVLTPDLANGNVAATIVYGRGFDDVNRGFVMYEAGHSHNKGTVADVAAQRAFLNFSFFQVQPKAPQLTFTGISAGQSINGNSTITGLNVSASSPLSGITFTYQWTSSCGGTFSNPTGTTTNFTAPVVGGTTDCVLSCVVTDNCGRKSFQSFPVKILGAAPPTANPDAQTVDPGCGAVSLTYNVLSNDSEPDGQLMTLTNVTGVANGSISFTASGNITYTSNAGFVGVETLTYTVCDNTSPIPLCSNSTYTINVGNPANLPNAVNDAFTIAEDNIGTFNVLSNDLPVVSGPYVVSAITTGPTNGRVSINTDNTITYVPNADYAGTDNFTYRIVNSIGYSRTATVTVTVTNDACDGGTYQTGSATATLVSGNEWSKIYTRPVNTGGTNLTSTTTYSINSGSNRLLVVAISAGGPNGIAAVPTVTWGGQSLTSLSVNRIDNNRSHSFIFYLNESGIAAASGTNLIVNMGTPTYFGYVVHAAVYQNVDQTTTVRNAVAPLISGTSSATPITATATANFAAGDQGIFVTGYSLNGGTGVATYSSVSANWTGSATLFGGATSSSVAIGPYYGGVGVRNITTAATNETVSMTVTATSNMRPSITVMSIIPGGATCSPIPARAPLGMQDTATTNSSTVVTIPVATNDELFGQPITSVTISTAPSSGSAIVVGNSIQYTPGAVGVATLQYTVTTANGSDVVRVYINVTSTPINANDDTPAGALSGDVQTITVKANDVDPEGTATATVTIAAAPKNGTATVNGSGEIVYTPNAGFTGNDTLRYSICEPAPACGVAACDTASVFLTVQNRAPVANPDTKDVTPCIANTINLTGNDTDAEGNSLTINIVSVSPVDGSVLVANPDGTITFTPQASAATTYTVTYNVTDNGVTPQNSANTTVTINVPNLVNTAPVALDDYADTTNMDEVVYYNVLDNDSDPQGHRLANPTVAVQPLHGIATVLASGAIQYTPNPGYAGADTLTYQVCDIPKDPNTCADVPDLCTTAKMFIFIVAPNSVVANNDENSTWVNTPVDGGVMSNDFDPEGDAKIFTGFISGGSPITSGNITVSGVDVTGTPVANAGTLTINADGTYTFNPANNFTGVVTVPYTIADNQANAAIDTAFLKITVNPLPAVSNSVIANNDENTTLINTAVSSTLFGNDADPQGNTFTATAFMVDTNSDGVPDAPGTIGTAIQISGVTPTGVPVSNAGMLTINADGTYTYTPAPDFTGTVNASYSITDALGAISNAVLTINILPDLNGSFNNAPAAGDDFAYTSVNTSVSASFVSNDNDPNANPVSLNGTTIVPGGPKTAIGTPVITAQGGTIQYFADGTYTYTPPVGYVGPDSEGYEICDVTAVNPQPLCTRAFIHILVGVDNSTRAINDETSTWQDINVSGGVLTNDYDAENHIQTFGTFLAQGITPGAPITSGATLSGVDKTGATVTAGTLSFDASGNYTFDPAATFTGTVLVPYRICDNGNLAACDTAYLLISVDPQPNTGINTVIANDDENISYGGAVSSTLFYNDKDPQNNTFMVSLFRYDSNGDGIPDVNTAPGTVTVAGVSYNGDPVANAGSLTINANGTYTYTPAVGFVGKIDVPYIITDALGATTGALLHIDVLADANGSGNDAPFAGDDFAYTTINLAVNGTVLSNDSDPNSNGLSVTAQTTTLPGVGTLVLASDGTYTFTPVTGYIGPATFTYQVCDVTAVVPQPLCADAVLHVLVGPGININGKVWIDANGNVIDPGAAEPETNAGGTLYVNLVNGAGNVVATSAVAADGTYSFSDITPGISYSLILSTTQGTIGNAAPAAALPAGWTGTGENRNGTIDLGTLNVIDNLTYGFTNTANYDFGIEQLPTAAAQSYTIPAPALNSFLTLNGTGAANSPAQLSGTDPEDGAIGTGNTMTITTVPSNAELYYDFGAGPVLLTSNTSISNYDPSKLQVKFTTLGSQIITFNYSITDAAGKADPTAAAYTINLLSGLPVEGLSLSAALSGTIVTLNWKTLNESNTSYFEIERSTDNRSFGKTGNRVNAAGTTVTEKLYKQTDEIKDLQTASIVYYRIKLTDLDGKISYSNIAAVRITKAIGIKAWPNPFVNSVQVQINSQVNTEVELRITDVEGRTILVQRNQVIRGNNQLGIEDLHRLPSGTYLLEVINKSDLSSTWFKLIRQ